MIRLSNRPARAGYPLLAIVGLVQLLAAQDARGSDTRGVAWRTDLGAAQAESKARNLPLWIQFTGPWCPNCRRMDRGAFVHPPIVQAGVDQFIPLKLRSDEYEGLAVSLGLTVLPSTVIVKPTGEVIDKWEGFGEPAEFLAFLDHAIARDGRLARRDPGKKKAETSEIALASYCPVSLVEKRKLVPGQPALTARHEGFEFRFADEAARASFLTKPEKYVPVNRGECPVRQVDVGVFQAGDPRWGVIYRGHLFLCSDAAERDRFVKNPERYAHIDLALRSACPHCWGLKPPTQLAQQSGLPSPSTATRRPLIPHAPALLEAVLAPVNRLRR
jgi:YHS domain-containing protein/thiol-disulfide isomerase/thioredoxin